MPPAPRPIPVLTYDGDSTFGWEDYAGRRSHPGSCDLPLRSARRGSAALFVSTGFMLLCGVLWCWFRGNLPARPAT